MLITPPKMASTALAVSVEAFAGVVLQTAITLQVLGCRLHRKGSPDLLDSPSMPMVSTPSLTSSLTRGELVTAVERVGQR